MYVHLSLSHYELIDFCPNVLIIGKYNQIVNHIKLSDSHMY